MNVFLNSLHTNRLAREEAKRQRKAAEARRLQILAAWKVLRDEDSGKLFFSNSVTKDSVWECPEGVSISDADIRWVFDVEEAAKKREAERKEAERIRKLKEEAERKAAEAERKRKILAAWKAAVLQFHSGQNHMEMPRGRVDPCNRFCVGAREGGAEKRGGAAAEAEGGGREEGCGGGAEEKRAGGKGGRGEEG